MARAVEIASCRWEGEQGTDDLDSTAFRLSKIRCLNQERFIGKDEVDSNRWGGEMSKVIRLIAIGSAGVPSESVPSLSKVAKEVCEKTTSLYRSVGFHLPWIGYLALSEGSIVGTCAFTSPPREGKVEIAYFTFPGFEGRGLATAMAEALIDIARQTDATVEITAQTLPEPNASHRILRKLGFELFRTVDHPDDGKVWEWRLPS
jgi:ribosomal-protein-alanine N-acetyltransferase